LASQNLSEKFIILIPTDISGNAPLQTQPCCCKGYARINAWRIQNKKLAHSAPQSIKTPKNKHKPADYLPFGHPEFRFRGGKESNSLPYVQN
jgi:hypothetical protein